MKRTKSASPSVKREYDHLSDLDMRSLIAKIKRLEAENESLREEVRVHREE